MNGRRHGNSYTREQAGCLWLSSDSLIEGGFFSLPILFRWLFGGSPMAF